MWATSCSHRVQIELRKPLWMGLAVSYVINPTTQNVLAIALNNNYDLWLQYFRACIVLCAHVRMYVLYFDSYYSIVTML